MGAMPEEISGIIPLIENKQEKTIGKRTYISGQISGIDTVLVFSRWGKVAAAATVAALIHEFGVTELIFTGVAGAIHHELKIGDIVIAKRLIQHDMDARPLMQQYEIPLLSKTFFETGSAELELAVNATEMLLNSENISRLIGGDELEKFKIQQPKLYVGDIGSGDQFFSGHEQKEQLLGQLPTLLCVEMEGAAVAQVCYEYEIPFVIIRAISDVADDNSHIDFLAFIREISSRYSTEIIRNIYQLAQAKM